VTTRTKVLLSVGVATLAAGVLGLVVVASALRAPPLARDLGLSRMDLRMGGSPGTAALQTLQTTTRTLADAHLESLESELTEVCGGSYALTVDDRVSRSLRSMGYRSSFYYTHWDIYLSYTMVCSSGPTYAVVVQVTEIPATGAAGPTGFDVLRSMVIEGGSRSVVRAFQ